MHLFRYSTSPYSLPLRQQLTGVYGHNKVASAVTASEIQQHQHPSHASMRLGINNTPNNSIKGKNNMISHHSGSQVQVEDIGPDWTAEFPLYSQGLGQWPINPPTEGVQYYKQGLFE